MLTRLLCDEAVPLPSYPLRCAELVPILDVFFVLMTNSFCGEVHWSIWEEAAPKVEPEVAAPY